MGTSILIAPFIIPFIIYAFFRAMLNPSEFVGIISEVFNEEIFTGKIFDELYAYLSSPMFMDSLEESLETLAKYFS